MKKSKELTIKDDTSLKNEDWYRGLVDDCRAIVVERGTNARMEIVEGKWEMGQRINQENEEMDRKKGYGKRIIENLSNDLGISAVDLWNCVKFYKEIGVEQFEKAIPKLPEGKNVSWYKITLWLGDRKEKREDKIKQSYRLVDILDVFRLLIIKAGAVDEGEIEESVTEFKEALINYKKQN